jgi:long-chain acyl-CoA synthetase
VKEFEEYILKSLLNVSSGMAYIPPTLAAQVQERFKAPLIIGYGATETAGAVTVTRVTDDGKTATESAGRVVDHDHNEVIVGQVGELATQQPGTMLGY